MLDAITTHASTTLALVTTNPALAVLAVACVVADRIGSRA